MDDNYSPQRTGFNASQMPIKNRVHAIEVFTYL